jgi:hypothetical protein
MELNDIQSQQDFGVARGYICPVRLRYVVQPLAFGVSGAVHPDELLSAYETKFEVLRQQLSEKESYCADLRDCDYFRPIPRTDRFLRD